MRLLTLTLANDIRLSTSFWLTIRHSHTNPLMDHLFSISCWEAPIMTPSMTQLSHRRFSTMERHLTVSINGGAFLSSIYYPFMSILMPT